MLQVEAVSAFADLFIIQVPGIWCGSPSRNMWRKWSEFLLFLTVALEKRIVWISVAYQVALTSVILRWCRF